MLNRNARTKDELRSDLLLARDPSCVKPEVETSARPNLCPLGANKRQKTHFFSDQDEDIHGRSVFDQQRCLLKMEAPPPPPIAVSSPLRPLPLLASTLATHGYAVLTVEPELVTAVSALASELEGFAALEADAQRTAATSLQLGRREVHEICLALLNIGLGEICGYGLGVIEVKLDLVYVQPFVD